MFLIIFNFVIHTFVRERLHTNFQSIYDYVVGFFAWQSPLSTIFSTNFHRFEYMNVHNK